MNIQNIRRLQEMERYALRAALAVTGSRIVESNPTDLLDGCSNGKGSLIGENGNGIILISNHRNIVLDFVAIASELMKRRHYAPHIVYGDNLEKGLEWLMRVNNGISMPRAGGMPLGRAKAKIRSTAEEGNASWIAQNTGRSYDWHDVTNPQVLRLLRSKPTKTELSVGVVSVSYEWEPNAVSLAEQLYLKEIQGDAYVKAEGLDFEHTMKGILGRPGKIALKFYRPQPLSELDAETVDSMIYEGQEIFEPSTVALRVLEDGCFDEEMFASVPRLYRQFMAAAPEYRMKVLEMYANPLRDKLRVGVENLVTSFSSSSATCGGQYGHQRE